MMMEVVYRHRKEFDLEPMQFRARDAWVARPLDGGCAVISAERFAHLDVDSIREENYARWTDIISGVCDESVPVSPEHIEKAARKTYVEFSGCLFQSRYLRLAADILTLRGYGVCHIEAAEAQDSMARETRQIRVRFPDGDQLICIPLQHWVKAPKRSVCPLF